LQESGAIRGERLHSFTGKGIWLLLYPKGEVTLSPAEKPALRYFPLFWRQELTQYLQTLYDESVGAVVLGMLVGETDGLGLGEEIWLSESGLYHIVSVSGLHCAFLVSLVQLCLPRRRKTMTLCAIPLLILYTLLVGAPPSMVRAAWMQSSLLLAPLFRRENDAPTTLSVASAILLLQNPYAVGSIAFQLSFSALAGILWLSPRVYGRLVDEESGRLRKFAAASLATTAGALLLTTPLTALYFNNLPLVSPLANLLGLPLVNAVFWGACLSLVLGLFSLPLAQALAAGIQWLCQLLLALCRLLSEIPYHAVYFSTETMRIWLYLSYALLALGLLLKRKRLWYLCGLCILLTLGGALRYEAKQTQTGLLQLRLLDVGQGQSLLLYTKTHTAVVDCGSSTSYLTAGDIAADLLALQGRNTLDALILTHLHKDHANGAEHLLYRLQVKTLYLPYTDEPSDLQTQLETLALQRGTELCYVETNTQIALDTAELTLYPPVGSGGNENGLVVLGAAGDFQLLVTGDMSAKTEKKLLRRDTLPDIDLLVVGHHGSKFATSQELLEVVQPEEGWISVGYNSYGHPAESTLERMQAQSMTVLRTDEQGDLQKTVEEGKA
jgi:competence protein ComEC